MPSTKPDKRPLTLAITQKYYNLVLVDLTAKVSYGRFRVQRSLAWLELFVLAPILLQA
jgi:hypothetical protein